jgi:transcriptional regulator with XRE-family HTH domain
VGIVTSIEASVMTADEFKELRGRLAAARGAQITQDDLAEEMGLSRASIARYEGGEEIPEKSARHLRLLVAVAEG